MLFVLIICGAIHCLTVSLICGGEGLRSVFRPEWWPGYVVYAVLLFVAARLLRPVHHDDDDEDAALEGVIPVPRSHEEKEEDAEDVAASVNAETDESDTTAESPADDANDAKLPPEDESEAMRMWREARSMEHDRIPSTDADNEYLRLVHGAAMAGLALAQAKLGEYAARRGKLVEAYYWTKLARINGNGAAAKLQRECRVKWLQRNCPPEHGNVHPFFTEQQGSVGRASLRLDCGFEKTAARQRLKELIAAGNEDAALFLKLGNL